MRDEDKTKEQLIEELNESRCKCTELETIIRDKNIYGLSRDKELAFHNIIDNSLDGFILIDEQGKVIEWNHGMEQISELTSEEVQGSFFGDAMGKLIPKGKEHMEDRHIKAMQQFLLTGQASWLNKLIEKEIQRPDGTVRYVQELSFPIKTDRGFMHGTIVRDITKRKKIEAELDKYCAYIEELVGEGTLEIRMINEQLSQQVYEREQAEKMLRRITDNMLDIISLIDTEGNFIYATPSHKTMLGYECEGLPGKSVFDLIHPDDRERVLKGLKISFNKGTNGRMEFRCSHANGHYLWLESIGNCLYDDNGQIFAWVVSSREITKRKHAEEALDIERRRLFSLLDIFPGLVYLQAADRSIRFVNRKFRKIFGDPGDEPCYEVITGRNEPCESCPTMRVFETKTPYNLEQIRKNKVYDVYQYPFYDHDGTLLVLKVAIDITERKEVEQEIARLDRLDLIGEMAAGIGHEVRNPMTTVRGFLQMLRKKEDCTNYWEYYDIMIEELDRANSIITEFLSLAKKKTADKMVKNINTVLETLSPLIQSDARESSKNVCFQLGEINDLLLDEKEIRQLILNLVRNGLEAMSPGGTLKISTFREGEEVILAVQDEDQELKQRYLRKLVNPSLQPRITGQV